MSKRLLAMLCWTAAALIGNAELAKAELIGRYQCNIVGAAIPEPVGDRNGHSILTYSYSCVGVEGVLKDAVVTAFAAAEWDGPKTTTAAALGVHRVPGGAAIAQVLEGTGSVILKEGKPVGTEMSGKTVFKFASGTLAALSGKTVSFVSKSTGLNRFEIVFTD